MKTIRIACIMVFAFFLARLAFPQNKVVWKGGTPGMTHAWNCPKNWSSHRVPDTFSDVIIPDVSSTSLAFPVIREGSHEINSLLLYSNATLTIEEGAMLSIYNPDQSQYEPERILGKGRLTITLDSASRVSSKGVAIHEVIH